jgi:hypothetical protein
VLILFLCLLTTGCSGRQLSTEQKVADFEYLFEVLRDNHPYLALKARTEGYDWVSHHDEYEAMVRGTKNDAEFARAIKTVLTLINNGHTGVADPLSTTLSPRPQGINDALWAAWEAQYAGIDMLVAERWWTLSRSTVDAADAAQYPCVYAVYNSGQYVVVSASPDLSDRVDIRAGLRVETVNGHEVHAYVAGLRGTEWLRYDPIRKRVYQRVLAMPLGEVDIRLVSSAGDVTEIRSTGRTAHYPVLYSRLPVLDMAASGASYPRTAGDLYVCILGGDVGYLRVAKMTLWSDTARMEQESSLLKDFFRDIKDLPALIIDIRGNPGGQDPAWFRIVEMLTPTEVRREAALVMRTGALIQPFADYLEAAVGPSEIIDRDRTNLDLPPEALSDSYRDPVRSTVMLEPDPDSVDYTGKVFLLVDDGVYSSAENFAAFCKGSGWATLVGSPTGGDGLGWEAAVCRLPNSGLVFKFPMAMGLNPDMTANEETHTAPDVLVEQSLEDLLKAAVIGPSARPDPNSDTVLRTCLELVRRGASKS